MLLLQEAARWLVLFDCLPQFVAFFCESPLAAIRQIRATSGGCTFDWSLLPAISESIKSCATSRGGGRGELAADAVVLRLNECQTLSGFNTFAWEKHGSSSAAWKEREMGVGKSRRARNEEEGRKEEEASGVLAVASFREYPLPHLHKHCISIAVTVAAQLRLFWYMGVCVCVCV